MASRKLTFVKYGLLLLLSACQDPNAIALKIGAPPKQALNLRSFETRQFDSADEKTLLVAATAALQDLGYTVTESAPAVGVVAASKQRSAREAGQIAAQMVLTVGMAMFGMVNIPTWDESQSIHATVVISPVGTGTDEEARVSFDRYITNNHGQMWRTELITDPKIYSGFFSHLNASLKLQESQS